MSIRKIVPWMASVGILFVIGWKSKDLLSKLWQELSVRQQDGFILGVTGLLVGVLGSVLASVIYSKVQKEIWQNDVSRVVETLSSMAGTMSCH